jgi:hypothetical protein
MAWVRRRCIVRLVARSRNQKNPVIIKTRQQRQAEVGGDHAVSQRAECDQQRRGHASVSVKVGAISELEPEPARNRQQQNHRPADSKSRRNRGEKRQPLPERHAEKYISHQTLRKFGFHLVSLNVVGQFGDPAKGPGRKEPDLLGVWIRDANEDHGNIRVAVRKGADGLLVEGAILQIALGTRTQTPETARESAVHQELQLLGQVRALGLAMRGAYLQVIGGGSVISRLSGLQESEDGSRRRVTSQRIGGNWSRLLSRSATLWQAAHRLGPQSGERYRDSKN